MQQAVTPGSLTDIALIEQGIAGERQARERLARACLPRVRRLVQLAYGGRPDADDVVQMVLVTVFRDLSGLRDPGSFRSWLDRVTYNVVRSHGRRRAVLNLFVASDRLDERPSAAVLSPDRQASRAQLFERLAGHLQAIRYKKRTAVVLSLFFGHVDSEIAEIMGCSVETAKKRVQHGRRELIAMAQDDTDCRELLEEAVR
jgi:RNA polymerase sigma factor (sigma-70 family)